MSSYSDVPDVVERGAAVYAPWLYQPRESPVPSSYIARSSEWVLGAVRTVGMVDASSLYGKNQVSISLDILSQPSTHVWFVDFQ